MANHRICDVHGCGNIHDANGYCKAHNHRFRRYGDPLGSGRKVAQRGELVSWIAENANHSGDACLKWPFGRRKAKGYGSVTFRGVSTAAHRVMCILAHGEPPTSKHAAAHSCGMGHEGCVNPKHLRWATSKENAADAVMHKKLRLGRYAET